MRFKNTPQAMDYFLEQALIKEACDKIGDYKKGNKAVDGMRRALKYFWHNDRYATSKFLDHESIIVQLWSAGYWLEVNAEHAIEILTKIEKEDSGIYSLSAKYTILEWKKGNLRSDQWD